MNEKITARIAGSGDAVYALTKKAAGEAHRAAKAYKIVGEINYWNRKKGKGTK
jgi:hypothetical protein|tara:strand:+ start:450 stop:608 length:159 start_codon:yes stop_codon:yes gene_type:complete